MEEKDISASGGAHRAYFAVWGGLLVLTALTIASSGAGLRYGVFLSLCIASCKAGLVLAFFMHLRREGKFLKAAVALSVLTLTALILLTFADVGYR